MMRRTIAAVSAALLAAATASAQTSVAGDWDVTVNSPQGTNSVRMSLAQDGDKLTGLFKSPLGELPFTGTVTGNDLKVSFTFPFQGQAIDILMVGTVDGSSMAGKATFGGFAEGDWSAKRAVAEDAASSSNGAAHEAAVSAAPTAGIGGTWDLMFRTPNGDFPATASITETGGQLSGTLSSQLGDAPVSGTLDGTSIKLALTAQGMQGPMSVTITGDLDGDQIVNGKADVSGLGLLDFTAKRKP